MIGRRATKDATFPALLAVSSNLKQRPRRANRVSIVYIKEIMSGNEESSKVDAPKVSLETGEPLGERMDLPQGLILPDDFESNPGRYEIWSIRVPVNFDAEQMLHKQKLTFTTKNGVANSKLSCMLTDKSSENDASAGKHQALVETEDTECSSMRILTKCKSRRSSENDEEENTAAEFKPTLHFDREFHLVGDPNVVEDVLVKSNLKLDTELAPSLEKVQESNLDTKGYPWRVPYTVVPQATNLKRKWTPPGSNSSIAKARLVSTAIKIQDEVKTTTKTKAQKDKSKSKHKHRKEKKHKS
jgi:hypothetical protein